MPTPEPKDDAEELDELPPLDPSFDDERGDPDEAELVALLDPLEEDVDMDPEPPIPELELGLEVPEEPDMLDDEHEVILDIQGLLTLADEAEPSEDGDSAGPEKLDPAADIREIEEPIVGSLEEGTDEPLEDLISEDLPELDADEAGGLEDETSWLAAEPMLDEEMPEWSERPWVVTRHEGAGSDLGALALAEGRVWVAGTRLCAIDRTGSLQVFPTSSRVVRLAGLGSGVVTFSASDALEAWSEDGLTRQLTGHRECLGLTTDAPAQIGISALGDGARAFLLSAESNRIAVSHDSGATFQGSELGGKVQALSVGAPARLVVQGNEGFSLLEAGAPGATLSRVELDALAEETARGAGLLLGSAGRVVALASRDRGLVVSADGGRSFSRVPSTVHATALCLGETRGRPRVWLAVFIESEERSVVIEVDVTTRSAEIVAELDRADLAPAHEVDDGRVSALVWDGASGWLWAAGGSGLYRITPPASSS